jgi:hypothetical protein
MEINIQGFQASMNNVTEEQIQELVQILGIPDQFYQRSECNERLKRKYGIDGKNESVSLSLGQLEPPANPFKKGYYAFPLLKLYGAFFENCPEFQFGNLLQFLNHSFSWKPKLLNIVYTDDQQCLTVEDYRQWLGTDWKSYCTGSLCKMPPEEVTVAGFPSRFQLGIPTSKANCATVYVGPGTGLLKHEITFRDPTKIKYLLEEYNSASPERFDERVIEALVSCIDFVTPSSHRTKSPGKYVRQPKFQRFISLDVKKINWSGVKKQQLSEKLRAGKPHQKLLNTSARLQNLISRCPASPTVAGEALPGFFNST